MHKTQFLQTLAYIIAVDSVHAYLLALHFSLLALAACAREYKYVRPTITEENVIEIEGGRSEIHKVIFFFEIFTTSVDKL